MSSAVRRYPLAITRMARERTIGELRVQQDRGDQVGDEHRGRVDGDEGVDRTPLNATKRPENEVEGDRKAENDGQSQPLLRCARRQARENEMLVFLDRCGGPLPPQRLQLGLARWSATETSPACSARQRRGDLSPCVPVGCGGTRVSMRPFGNPPSQRAADAGT